MIETETEARDHLISNRVYDFLKDLITIIFPAIGALYGAIAVLWGLPYSSEVMGSMAALAIFFGVFLKMGTASYNNSTAKFDGTIETSEDAATGKKTYMLALDSDPADLDSRSQVVFKVAPSKDS